MKSPRLSAMLTLVLGLAALATARCAEKETTADAAVPPAPPPVANVTPVVATTAAPAPAPVFARWSDIKDVTFLARADFFTGLAKLEGMVDQQMSELVAKRARMAGRVDTKEWDFRMKEMGRARTYLTAMGEELGKASPETWDQEKDKVGRAWVQTQNAFDKVKASTTF